MSKTLKYQCMALKKLNIKNSEKYVGTTKLIM